MRSAPDEDEKAFREAVARLWPAAKGSLAQVRRPCTRPTCAACRRGEKHPGWIFTFRDQGRLRCRYVRPALVPRLRRAIANGREIEALLTQAGAALIAAHRREQGGRAGKGKGRPR